MISTPLFVRCLAVVGLLLGGLTARAQTDMSPRLTDSLLTRVRNHPQADTVRVKLLNGVARSVIFRDPSKALPYLRQSQALARQISYHRGELVSVSIQAAAYQLRGDADSARILNRRVIRMARGPKDEKDIAKAYNNIGGTFMQQDRYDSAHYYLVRGLRMYEKLNDHLLAASALGNLSNISKLLGDYPQALEYAQAYQRQPAAVRQPTYDVTSMLLVGEAHDKMNHRPEARQAYEQALVLARKHGLKVQESDALVRLAALNKAVGRLAEAEVASRLVQDINRQMVKGDDARTFILADAGRQQQRQGHLKEARRLFERSLAAANEQGNLRGRQQAHELLGGLAAALGDYREAYRQRIRAGQVGDSLLNGTKARELALAQTQFDTERKDAQNRELRQQQQLQQAENRVLASQKEVQQAQLRTQEQTLRRRNFQLIASLVIAGLLLGLGYLLYARRRLRREVEFAQERQTLERLRASAVLDAEEAERRRIGADLHDGVGQMLSVVKLNVDALNEELQTALSPDQSRRFTDALDLVDESVREVRSISHNLLPNALIKRGLALAVREFLDTMQRSARRLRIRLETLGLDDTRLDPAVESALYRVIQELVQNIVKHAQATEMDLQLIRHPGELTLLVEDNGIGFDLATLGPEVGIGLRNIESRVSYLGGTLHVDSRPGRGTTVTATVPLPE
ncbi:tetratricopeptide repeat protein [Hymenobacter sp. ASUV-10]|uniref:Oxygen sensor histidine kinase NreB n=1 Tax=Hymenobacter aranciens TaxID=3063996 RepID=A0ABT9BGW8_9BACT|nr:tetratricopeptide repeat protein [Hymenobacter sp. ASUV-10]MDO7877518.1 tetratricopeptide repeat protein [Hymenobacter sp. ASUV-10]